MKERPILFSGPMVRAILDGTKTQTRRVVKPQPFWSHYLQPMWGKSPGRNPVEFGEKWLWREVGPDYPDGESDDRRCKFGVPGDRLWVKETFAPRDEQAMNEKDKEHIFYRADYETKYESDGLWKPSIYMPRWASRITLEITGIRVERLQDISEADSNAEGLETVSAGNFGAWKNYRFKTSHPRRGTVLTDEEHRLVGYQCPVRSYRSLWEHINGLDSWATNPWVWVIEFRRIDQ